MIGYAPGVAPADALDKALTGELPNDPTNAEVLEVLDPLEVAALEADATAPAGETDEPGPADDDDADTLEHDDAEHEHEHADSDDPDGSGAEGEHEQPTPEMVADAEQAVEIEKAQAAYEKRIRKAIGPGVELETCEACAGMGLVPPGGMPDEPELLAHPNFKRCEACDGYGAVRTGSRLQGSDVASCIDCQGNGYLTQRQLGDTPPIGASNGHAEGQWDAPSWLGDPSIGKGAQ